MEEKIIVTRLKEVCRSLGVSERKFSVSIGKSTGYINSLRKTKGEGIPSDVLSKISDAFPQVNREYISEGIGDPLLDETDTLRPPYGVQPAADNYKELFLAYRQDLAEARDEIKRLREAYFQLLESNNILMANYSALQAACLQTGTNPMSRDIIETKKA